MIKTFHHKNPKTIWMDIAWHYMVNKKLCLGLSISSMSVILTCAGSPTVFRGFPKVSQVRNTCSLLIPSPRGPTRPKVSHLSLSRSHCTGRAWNDLGGHWPVLKLSLFVRQSHRKQVSALSYIIITSSYEWKRLAALIVYLYYKRPRIKNYWWGVKYAVKRSRSGCTHLHQCGGSRVQNTLCPFTNVVS